MARAGSAWWPGGRTAQNERSARPSIAMSIPSSSAPTRRRRCTDAAVDGYRAPWWLPGGHLQTIVAALIGTLFALAQFVATRLILVVNPKVVNANTLAELVQLAKAQPGMPYSSSGHGSPGHLGMELLKARTGAAPEPARQGISAARPARSTRRGAPRARGRRGGSRAARRRRLRGRRPVADVARGRDRGASRRGPACPA